MYMCMDITFTYMLPTICMCEYDTQHTSHTYGLCLWEKRKGMDLGHFYFWLFPEGLQKARSRLTLRPIGLEAGAGFAPPACETHTDSSRIRGESCPGH